MFVGLLALKRFRLAVRVIIGSYERIFFFLFEFALFPALFFHRIKQINDLFRCILHYAYEIGLFEPAVNDDLGNLSPELFIFFAGLGKIGDVTP